MLKRIQAEKRGFTLVEIIVVIAIMIILVAMLVPNIVGYVDKSNQTAVAAEAKNIYTAAQSACAITESSPTTKASPTTFRTVTYEGETYSLFCISDATVAGVLAAPESASTRDEYVAKTMCDILGIQEGNDHFDFNQGISGSYEPYGQSVTSYNNTHSQPGLIIAYDRNGVHFVEWGRDGYLAHVDAGGNVLCKEGATFASVS